MTQLRSAPIVEERDSLETLAQVETSYDVPDLFYRREMLRELAVSGLDCDLSAFAFGIGSVLVTVPKLVINRVRRGTRSGGCIETDEFERQRIEASIDRYSPAFSLGVPVGVAGVTAIAYNAGTLWHRYGPEIIEVYHALQGMTPFH